MRIPRAISVLVDSFQKLPGIGPKSAQRLTYYLLHVPQIELDNFSDAVSHLKKDTILCSTCRNVGESDPCLICTDLSRDTLTILVVEQPLDVLAFEKTGKYKGLYHVLHGAINPLENIGPDEIFIKDLLDRVRDRDVREIIIATNPTMEGEATSMYITKQLKSLSQISNLKITRLGMGIPTGADLEYADEVTLSQALQGRRDI